MEKDYKRNAEIFKALSDETRLRIINMVSGGEICACEILKCFDITQPTLSYHMKILCDSDLVSARRDGQWIRYSLKKENFEIIRDLFADLCLDISKERILDCR